jgi:hypothetical protein
LIGCWQLFAIEYPTKQSAKSVTESRSEAAVKGDLREPRSGLALDGGGSGGNPGLSADAVTHLLDVFLYLASRGWRLDLLC